jgi:hypothetical protein
VNSAVPGIAMRSILTCYASHLFRIWKYCEYVCPFSLSCKLEVTFVLGREMFMFAVYQRKRHVEDLAGSLLHFTFLRFLLVMQTCRL